MRDFNKRNIDPLKVFNTHLWYMTRKNEEFVNLLRSKCSDNIFCKVQRGDSRRLKLSDNYVDLIVTSPPYVTSYEYGELQQLSTLWFNFANDISELKRNYVGTSSRRYSQGTVDSKIAYQIVKKLSTKNKALGRHVKNYYFDLDRSFKEMYRVLKKRKYLCLILGNTEYNDTKILNVEVAIELLKKIGFLIERIIKRRVSSKKFTSYRDKQGRFTNNKNERKIYHYEYIIVSKKN
jgi:DNA modification methylase